MGLNATILDVDCKVAMKRGIVNKVFLNILSLIAESDGKFVMTIM